MKILGVIDSCGGGDWPPLIALAIGMQKRGHEVRLICDAKAACAFKSTGLKVHCLPFQPSLSEALNFAFATIFASGGELTPGSPNPLKIWAGRCLETSLSSLGRWQPELVLGSLLCVGFADQLAEAIGIPWCFVNPSFCFGDGLRFPRREDFSPAGYQMYSYWIYPLVQRAALVIHATDPLFDPSPQQLSAKNIHTGPLFWEQPGKLPKSFQEGGFRRVLISLSMVPQAGDLEIVRASLAAFSAMNVKVLVTLSAEHENEILGEIPPNVTVEEYVPHSEVLAMSRLVISHAGHGLVMKAMYHGTPMILVPWGRDQPGVSARAEALGVARVIRKEDLSAKKLAQVVTESIQDSSLYHRVYLESLRLKKHDGVEFACSQLEKWRKDLKSFQD